MGKSTAYIGTKMDLDGTVVHSILPQSCNESSAPTTLHLHQRLRLHDLFSSPFPFPTLDTFDSIRTP